MFEAAQERGNEGLMLKDPDSIYAPGRRGYAWLKLKKALTTLDCVVVGVEVGHGRRHGVLSDYTFAVLDDRPEATPGALVTIGKAYSGLTDVEIATMTRWFEEHTICAPRSLSGRRADGRRRDRVRRHPPFEPPCVRFRPSLPAHRPHPRRQDACGHRPAQHGRRAPRPTRGGRPLRRAHERRQDRQRRCGDERRRADRRRAGMTNLVEGPFDAERVRNMREVLTATGAGIYLATHLAGPVPAESMAAARESDEMELRVGRVGPDREDDLLQRDREARAVVAAVLQAAPDRMAIVHGAAEGARLVAIEALRDASPDRRAVGIVAVGDHEASVIEALRGVAAASGGRVTVAGADAAAGAGEVPAAALVAIAHVGSDGSLVDVERLSALARAGGARVLLDASLTCGARPVEVAALGVDAVVADTHRWLLGPEATAVVWLGPALGDDAPTTLRSASAPFARGTLIALARSVGWLLMYAELPWILERTRLLAERLLERPRGDRRCRAAHRP